MRGRPTPTVGTRERRRVVVGAAILGILLTAGGIWWWLAGGESRGLRRVVAALQRRDPATLARLADPDEVSKGRITAAKVKAVLESTLWRFEPVVDDVLVGPGGRKGRMRERPIWDVFWKDRSSGQPLPTQAPAGTGPPRQQYWCMITLVPTKHGWRYSFDDLMWTLCRSTYGDGWDSWHRLATSAGLDPKGFDTLRKWERTRAARIQRKP